MDSLRPERDELDRFQNRKNKPVNSLDSSSSTTTLKKDQKTVRRTSPVVVLFLVVLVFVCSGLGWLVVDQQSRLTSVQKELSDTSGFIGQSKLLLARLEGELSETGEELEQSGSAAQRKLAFLDSEMRKLWVISNERNKKLIQSNVGAIAEMEARLTKQVSSQKALVAKSEARSEAARATLNESIVKLGEGIDPLKSRIASVASDAVINRAEWEENFDNLKSEFSDNQKLSDKVTESEQAIASIDASRRQLNDRIVKLERKLNAIQLQLNGAEKTTHVQ